VRQGKVRKHNFETNIETLLRLELESRGLKDGWDFVSQYPVKGSFILDFAFIVASRERVKAE